MNDAKRYRSSWRHTAITLAVTATTVMLSHAAYAQRATTDRGTPGGITFTKDVGVVDDLTAQVRWPRFDRSHPPIFSKSCWHHRYQPLIRRPRRHRKRGRPDDEIGLPEL